MQKEFPEAEIFEIKKTELKNPIIFAGFVGAGLVGPLAINHIITELKMTEIAVMRLVKPGPAVTRTKARCSVDVSLKYSAAIPAATSWTKGMQVISCRTPSSRCMQLPPATKKQWV